MSRRACISFLLLAVFFEAIALVNIRYKSRSLKAQLTKIQSAGHDLKRENRRLQIELATVADLRDIHAYSTEELDMVFPQIADETMILLAPRK